MRLFWLRLVGIGLLFSGLVGCPQPPVEICNNTTDDDGDGLADCEDSDCAQVQECLAEVCDNGADDNGDGLADCQDPACSEEAVCNVPPEAQDDAFSTDEDTALTLSADELLANDEDGNGDTLTVTTVANAQSGTVALDGTDITFTPNADFNGEASFEYTVDDGNGGSDTALVTITVAPVDDLPVANADADITDEDTAVTTDVLANDQNLGDGGILVTIASPPAGGVATINADNTVTYTPNADFNGTDVYTYSVEDIDGNLAVATVFVGVNAVDDLPVAVDDASTTDEDAAVTTDVLANDQNLGDGGIVVSIAAQPANGAATVNADNTITYTPNLDFNGADSYTYQVSDVDGDSDTAAVSLSITAVIECGDGDLEGTEECDDGNAVNGDGCEADCTFTCASGSGADRVVFDSASGHCFAGFDGTAQTYDEAQTFCQSLGGHLPTIASATENTAARAASRITDFPWLGADDRAVEDADDGIPGDDFVWVTGEPFAFTNFNTLLGQPDDQDGTGIGALGDCLFYTRGNDRWADTNCDITDFVLGTICEFDLVFEPQQTLAAGFSTQSVAIGDLNGDGAQDLVAANFGVNNLGVFLGNGDGSFQAQVTFAAGAGPVSVAIGDINGDGAQDLVTANLFSSDASVLLGNGDGSFQAQLTFTVGIQPFSVAIGDINGDGDQDLFTANNSNDVSVLLGNGDGSFQAQLTSAVGFGPRSVAIGDVDGNGFQDLVTANNSSNDVSVLSGNGNGLFKPQVTFAVGVTPRSVAIGDVNGDGEPDLVTANFDSNTVSVLLGNGVGSFQAQVAFAAGFGPVSVAIGDINGDGAQDLVTANVGSDNVSVLLGNGDGSFQVQVAFAAGDEPSSVAVGDFNGDTLPDLVTANRFSGDLSVLLGSF